MNYSASDILVRRVCIYPVCIFWLQNSAVIMTDGISISARFSVLRRCSPDSTWPVQAGVPGSAQCCTVTSLQVSQSSGRTVISPPPQSLLETQTANISHPRLLCDRDPVSVSMWVGGEMTSLIERYYQSVQSDSRETVHQDSDEEDDGNNDENDSRDESLSQSNSSTSASVSTNSVCFLIIKTAPIDLPTVTVMQHRVLNFSWLYYFIFLVNNSFLWQWN